MPSELVVIVDDSLTSRKILERLSDSLGEGVGAKAFAEPEAALSFCRDNPHDLIVLAEPVAGLRAADFVRSLHAEPACADIPVLVIGADEDRAAIERARSAGAADHLLRPIDHCEFRTRVRHQLLRRRSQQRKRDAQQALEARWQPNGDDHHGLHRAHEALLRVIDFIPMMICVIGRDGRYIFVNQRFASFVGVRANRLLGRRPVEAHDDPLAHCLADSDARSLGGEIVASPFEEEILDRHGRRCVLLTSKAILSGGDPDDPMLVTALLDITAGKRIELDLAAAKEQVEIANRSKVEFLANMSHELRTPLNAIIGFSQVIAGEMLGPIGTSKYTGYARDILSSAERLLGIISNILDVSRLETGTLELAEELVNISKITADLVQLAEPKARAASVKIAVRDEDPIPLLRADPRKVKQALISLLGNAIKFSRPGGLVEIVLRSRGGALIIAITDRGIGMDAREVELAMSRFGQVASPWVRKHDGAGLGLPLAIGLIELHGGTLAIRSSKGVGTEVTVTFPAERSEPMLIAMGSQVAISGRI